ncbi:small hydrophobic protein [Wufeng Apodemus chevrieri jeilongvirus 1]|uniref:Small hydrophobic protein n=1 Tax=Wufeng Apodemus chevrieri jeilongvirus 1 TaxID=2928987 RepID=A0A8T9KMA2_9MONO|nr:small hydrophobic protein [Wufeng Apodemus chevrieri jeilongvirus 1]
MVLSGLARHGTIKNRVTGYSFTEAAIMKNLGSMILTFCSLLIHNHTLCHSMDREVSITIFIFAFLYAFLFIKSIIWFILLTYRLSLLRNELYQKLVNLNNELVFIQGQNAAAEATRLVFPPPYTQFSDV